MECDEKIVPLPEIKRLFAAKYVEELDDHVIETMKHAIEVFTNNFNCINAFLRSKLTFAQFPHTLRCSLSTKLNTFLSQK